MILSLLTIEANRYRKKGLGNCIAAFLLLIAFHTGLFKISQWLWDPHVENKRTYVIVVGCLIHSLTVLFCLAIHLPSYRWKLPALEKHRVEPRKLWHWERPLWNQLFHKTIKTLLLVHLVYFPLGVILGMIKIKLRFEFPSFSTHVSHLLLCLVCEDTLFYWSHRLFHTFPVLYQRIHKMHHQYDSPFANAAEHTHPVEYLLGNMLPAASGILLLGEKMHVFSYFVFIFIRLMNTEETHSGIDVPWSPMRVLPFATSASFHNFHHSNNSGAYGSLFYLWDYFTTTGNTFFASSHTQKIAD